MSGGTGGGLSLPFLRLAPGGRFTVVIVEVADKKIGSEMSHLLIDFFRFAGMRPALWNPGPVAFVGVTAVDVTGDSYRDGVELAENGAIGDGEGLGDSPAVWKACKSLESKAPGNVDLLLLLDLPETEVAEPGPSA